MLKPVNSFSYQYDLMDVNQGILFAHLGDLKTESDSLDKLQYADELEYIFHLIRSSFLYVSVTDNYLPAQKFEDKNVYLQSFYVHSLPFNSELSASEVEQWNDLVKLVSADFDERKEAALGGRCTYEVLERFVRDHLEDFDYPDRERLDPIKLTNLVLFVYDYCNLTMREAHLHPGLDKYIKGEITLRDKEYQMPLRICASVSKYVDDYVKIEDGQWPEVVYSLPTVRISPIVRNPHASDSNLCAMFVDLMHKFFLSFGLRRKGKSQWTKAEQMLIYDLLRLFGMCRSSKSAAESKYVTTVMKEYGDYFSSCNLRSWVRISQAYCYLICCPVEEFVKKRQTINQPFLSLNDFEEINTKVAQEDHQFEEHRIEVNDLPDDLKRPLGELAGHSVKVTHTEFGHLCYASMFREEYKDSDVVWNPNLDYVVSLIKLEFDYITFFPSIPDYLVIRNDLQNPEVMKRLLASLQKDLIERLEVIPRGLFEPSKVKGIIQNFYNYLPRQDRATFDVEKFYVLCLFIFDMIYVTFKEPAISPHLRLFQQSSVYINGDRHSSTMLADDLLTTYLEQPYSWVIGDTDKERFQELREPNMFVPTNIFPVRLESCNVKNMTAMFYDLFVRFFNFMGLTKRSDVKYLSDQENILVSELAKCCGICDTDNPNSVRAMFMTNKDYFRNCALHRAIRENEYGYLMLNTMSDELFGANYPAE